MPGSEKRREKVEQGTRPASRINQKADVFRKYKRNNFSVSESQKINCSVHGWQERAFVCQHIGQSLHTGVPVGFYWSSQDSSPQPDAWCGDCEKDRLAAGGDWTPEVSAKLVSSCSVVRVATTPNPSGPKGAK